MSTDRDTKRPDLAPAGGTNPMGGELFTVTQTDYKDGRTHRINVWRGQTIGAPTQK